MNNAVYSKSWRKGQQPGMTQRSCNYSGGPGLPRPELNIGNTVEKDCSLGRGIGGGGGGGGETRVKHEKKKFNEIIVINATSEIKKAY
jgi:hypothetical protein